MTQTQTIYTNSQLALAAYGTFPPGASPTTASLVNAGMTTQQAQDFAPKWFVVDQYQDASGVAATIFQEIGTSKQYLAIRGTEGLADINADYILALGFPSYLNPQWIQLRTQVQAWLSAGRLSSGITVTGHSLGGYLAAAIGTWFRPQVSDIYMYNAPGVGGVIGNVFNAFRALFELGDSALVSGITNIRGTAGVSLISNLGAQLAPPIFVETENVLNPITNHSIIGITDALALYETYNALAPALSFQQIGAIYRSASDRTERTHEQALDGLRRLFGFTSATGIGNRDAYYSNLFALRQSAGYQALSGSAAVRVATGGLALQGNQDFGKFLTAYYLLPVTSVPTLIEEIQLVN